MKDTTTPRAGYVALVDQPQKLSFLLRHRGDQRQSMASTRSSTNKEPSVVTDQNSLARELGTQAPTISKMLKGEANLAQSWVAKICEIYLVEADHLINSDFSRFETIYSTARSGWASFLGRSILHTGKILTEPPRFRAPVLRLSRTIPEVVFDTPFWCCFECPSLGGSDQSWKHWEFAVFNVTFSTDKITTYHPNICAWAGSQRPLFPGSGTFVFPPDGQEMTSSPEDIGEHALICLTIKPGKDDRISELARRDFIPCGQDELAKLLTLAIAKREAGLAVARYRVVRPR